MQNLDVLYFPLNGIRLIEASAGTGKTYNLIIIYLRLLLNLTENHFNNSYPLTVQNILVVTFTKSATQELQKRIKNSIKQFQLDCIQGYSNNYLFSKMLLQINNMSSVINLLSKAIKEIDQAPIFTIHSFFLKILTEYNINLNMLFNVTITEDELIHYQQACTDFWRRQFYLLPSNIANYIQQNWKNPKELLKDIVAYISQNTPDFHYHQHYNSNKKILTYYSEIIISIKHIKTQWILHKNKITCIIKTYSNNNRIYNKNNLTRWIKTISDWSIQPTLDHTIPTYLKRFKLSELKINKNQTCKEIFLFNIIEKLYQQLSSFKTFILNTTIYEIRYNSNNSKYSKSKITFNDLVDLLFNNIVRHKNNILIQKIIQQYPIAIIDEFQDTDSNQCEIFFTLYSNQIKNSLILIGDPKQSIYGFRGANIFTYIKIRQSVSYKYNLNINWRSSPNMINAINQLFNVANPFILQDIPYIPTKTAYRNQIYNFFIHHKPQPAICFWLHNQIITINNYKTIMTQECVTVIQNLLSHINKQTAWLKNNKYEKKILQTSDITILVKNYAEASMIQSALSRADIPTTFLSNRKNIFETIEAYELLLLLKSILYPTYKTICTALSTIFFGFTANHIENLYNNNNENQWHKIFTEFYEYHNIWKKYGIFSMIQKIIFQYKIPTKLITMHTGKHNLINILHLGELLNSVSQEIQNQHELTQWLELQLTQTKYQLILPEYALRFNYDHNVIKISTIHKSKGLEFPITILPFIANCTHNKKKYLNNIKKNISYSNISNSPISTYEEKLSEDLRLLYVAITRSIYHCAIGIAPITYKSCATSQDITDLHHSAIGYLIQKKTPSSSESLLKYLQKLNIYSNRNISFRLLSKKKHIPFITTKLLPNRLLSYKTYNLSNSIYNYSWNITSYSALKNQHVPTSSTQINLQKLLNINLNHNLQTDKHISMLPTVHTFPQGKIYGIFFHNLFKILDFKKNINMQTIYKQMVLHNINSYWKSTIYQWIYTIINTPLNNKNLTLSKINPYNKQTELKFYLNISSNVTTQELDLLCKHYDYLSSQSSELTCTTITGMLTGFIDLIFYWNRKYYLLDYKTNWLGENNNFYIQSIIEQEIIKHRYELQYQLYTLALHRFLQHRIISYNYEKHFGGVYYLFVRGLNGISTKNGIYFCRPKWEFIKKLDNLFLKNKNF